MKELILSLRAKGYTYKQIVREVGCAKSLVSYYCGVGQADKTLGRQRQSRSKKRAYLQKIKQNFPCMDCGENYPYWVMDFDHRGDKLFGLGGGALALYSWDQILEEVKKCDIVCANCHRDRTHTRSVQSGDDALDVEINYL